MLELGKVLLIGVIFLSGNLIFSQSEGTVKSERAKAHERSEALKSNYPRNVSLEPEILKAADDFRNRENLVEARSLYTHVIQDAPNNAAKVQATYGLAKCAMAEQDFDALNNNVQMLLDTYGNEKKTPERLYELGKALIKDGKIDEANALFDRMAQKNNPECQIWAQAGKMRLSDELKKLAATDQIAVEVIKTYPNHADLPLILHGICLNRITVGANQAAAQLAALFLDTLPTQPNACILSGDRAIALIAIDELDEARQEYARLKNMSEDGAELNRQAQRIGGAMRNKGNKDEGLMIIREASTRAIEPAAGVRAQAEIALAQFRLGKEAEGTATYQQMQQVYQNVPELKSALQRVAEGLYSLARDCKDKEEKEKLLQKTKGMFEEMIAMHAQYDTTAFKPNAYLYAGYCSRDLGNLSEAVVYANKSIEAADKLPAYPHRSYPHMLKALVYAQMVSSGTLEKAESKPLIKAEWEAVVANEKSQSPVNHVARGELNRLLKENLK